MNKTFSFCQKDDMTFFVLYKVLYEWVIHIYVPEIDVQECCVWYCGTCQFFWMGKGYIVHTYVNIHICTHINTHTYIFTYTRTHTYMYVFMYVHTYLRIYTHTHTVCAHTYIIYMYVCVIEGCSYKNGS